MFNDALRELRFKEIPNVFITLSINNVR